MAILPTLTAWASSHLSSILESKTESAFNTAFDRTFSASCTFVLNGQTLARDAYKAQLREQSADGFGEESTAVTIQGSTEVEGKQGELSGFVGLFYTALSESRFLVLGAPAESKATSSINLTIEPTEKNPQGNLPIRGYFDPRRVVSVNQVAAELTYHVTLPKASLPKAGPTKTELGPGPVQLPPNYDAKFRGLLSGLLNPGSGAFGGLFEPGPEIPPNASGAAEGLPGDGAFGVAPVNLPGETIGK